MKTEFKKNIRRDIYKSVKETYVPVGMVWRVKDPQLAQALHEKIMSYNSVWDADCDKPVTIIKDKQEKQVIIDPNGIVFDLNDREIGHTYAYRNTKSGEPNTGLYIAENITGIPIDTKINTLHDIENIYLKGTKLIYNTASITKGNIYNGCCTDTKEKQYISMDFANNAFYHITYFNNNKQIKRISPYRLQDYLPWHTFHIKDFMKTARYLTGIKYFDFSYHSIQKYLIKYYADRNISYPECNTDHADYAKINKMFKRSLNWKNPVKHITRETKGYGKKIRKIIFESPWKLEIFKLIKQIKNLDKIQKILSNKYCANIYLLFTTYSSIDSLKFLPKNMKVSLLTKIAEYISANDMSNTFTTVIDMLCSIARLHRKLAESEFEKINYSGTIPEIDIKLSDMIYKLDHVRKEFIYDKETSPSKYINNTHWEMKIPKDNIELHNWGERFHNCVGTYNDKIQNRKCNIITFWEDNAPVLCVEIHIRNNYVIQAYGTCNSHPDKITDTEFIENFVKINKLDYKNDTQQREVNLDDPDNIFMGMPQILR